MSTVQIYTSPARGHLYPIMDVALALQAAGHRVVVQTMAEERAVVEGAGVVHRPISPEIEALPLRDYRGGNPLAQLRATAATWLARAPHEVADLRTAMSQEQPDLLLVDANSWGAAAFAEAQGRPWAMFLPYVLPVPSRDAPAFGPGFPPPQHLGHRLRDRAVWRVQGAALRPALASMNRIRADLGAAELPDQPALYQRPDALLYRTAEPFEYPRRDWPANVRAIGPGLWAPPAAAVPWLAELPRPRVLVSVSTEFQDDGAIVDAALAGLGGQPGSLVVTTAALDPAQFTAPSDRVRIVRTLPHDQVIPHMDIVVTHGGMGTVQRSLAAGVPVVVTPWGRDQRETARRVEHSGAGVMVPRNRLRPDRLRTAVSEAFSRADQAAEVAAGFQAAGGAPRAVAVLEQLLGAVGPTSPAVHPPEGMTGGPRAR